MIMNKKIISISLVILLIIGMLSGCSGTNNAQADQTDNAQTDQTNSPADAGISSGSAETTESLTDTESSFDAVSLNSITENIKDEDTDSTWDESGSTLIMLDGTTATVTGSGATVSGSTVTITEAGTYVLSGTLSKGQILVSASKDDLVRLVLNGVDITADTNAAIYAAVADKLVLILAEGKTNTIADGTSYTYADTEKEEPNAAIFSKCDLSINGTGSLTVDGNFDHGIATKDDLVIADGNITVDTVNVALRGKDSVTILDGTFHLTSKEGDGIKSANDTDADKGWVLIKGGTFDISAYNDGIQAYTTLEINDGSFHIITGGGWPGGSLKRGSHAISNDGVVSGTNPTDGSYKGIKSSGSIVLNGGTFTISSYDDSVHCNGDITINGGNLAAQSGDDGIHADGTVTINGGMIDIKNSYEGIEGAYINLNGGKISVYSTDDGVNVNNSSGLLTIAGGELYINASGDGIDTNGSGVMTGGTAYIDGPTSSGDGALDYQNQFTISGGTLIAADCGNMSEAPGTESEQPSIMLYFTSNQQAGTEISLNSADGETLVSYSPQKDYSVVVISAEDMKVGDTYTILSNNTKLCDVTLSSAVTSIDSSGSAVSGRMGGSGGGMQGGPGGQMQGDPGGQMKGGPKGSGSV